MNGRKKSIMGKTITKVMNNEISDFYKRSKQSFKELYIDMVDFFGLEKIWDFILYEMDNMPKNKFTQEFLNFDEIDNLSKMIIK